MFAYRADVLMASGNCSYPNRIELTDEASLRELVVKDYVCAQYKSNYRSNDNFIGSDCLALDCDNDHSENPEDWVSPKDLKDWFPGVKIFIHYSRSNMKEKNGSKARPRFHALFPIEYTADKEAYRDLKKKVNAYCPYFDKQALDAARFFYGTENPEVEVIEGDINLNEFLDEEEFDAHFGEKIPSGSRNSTMSRFAAKILKKYGDTEEAHDLFLEEAEKCDPPLEDGELNTIWGSALRFFEKICKEGDYIPPDQFNDDNSYKPDDYSDVGQAEVLAKYFSSELRYSPQTHFIKFRKYYWEESEPGSQASAQELTRRQLKEAKRLIAQTHKKLRETGTLKILGSASKAKAEGLMSDDQRAALADYDDAMRYLAFVIKRRDSKNITATLKECRPMLEINVSDLDSDPFLLNTPNATYDLRLGLAGARDHKSEDFITKITSVSPSNKGKKQWTDFLETVFSGDKDLIEYVQLICGLAAIGKVYIEALIISYGEGGNGKSTFWNAIAKVFGLYYGNISADTLTVGCKRNVKPEMAEVKGKRLLIASESQEGARLNDSTVKQLCSTDDIFAEKKYKDPFSFKPCHTLVLYTNHLPRVSASDDGIWRRLIVIPFRNKLTGKGDIKNYGEILYENCGEYILSWIIEGAQKVISLDFTIPVPKVVQDAIDEYKEQNDWFHHFIADKCEVDPSFKESSNALYTAYRLYCTENNEFTRSTTDFYEALERNKFKRLTSKRKKYFIGLRLKPDGGDFDDETEPILTK